MVQSKSIYPSYSKNNDSISDNEAGLNMDM
jgi:hypothetical protein